MNPPGRVHLCDDSYISTLSLVIHHTTTREFRAQHNAEYPLFNSIHL